jgi:dihydroorotate dehydrogenase electron transfer subunit
LAAPASAPTPTWRQVTARVLRQTDYGADHLWLDLEAPIALGIPAPGQFVQILLPPNRAAALLPRPMSVASARVVRGRLVLGFLYAAVGTGTRALAALERGALVQLLGPLGRGFPLEEPGTPVLIAGGRGVAPLLFAADHLARSRRRSEFLFGARGREQLVGLDDAKRRIVRMRGRLHLCTDDGSRGWCGHVVSLLERVSPRFARPLVIHACGPHAMLRAIARWSLAHGTPAYLAMESVMACGTGVCRGCPLPRSDSGRRGAGSHLPSLLGNRDYAMCCTEGPVFEASDLDWTRIE